MLSRWCSSGARGTRAQRERASASEPCCRAGVQAAPEERGRRLNRQIRRLGVAMLVLFGALFLQLNVVQVLRADQYERKPDNTRAVLRDYLRPRGQIVSADGTV